MNTSDELLLEIKKKYEDFHILEALELFNNAHDCFSIDSQLTELFYNLLNNHRIDHIFTPSIVSNTINKCPNLPKKIIEKLESLAKSYKASALSPGEINVVAVQPHGSGGYVFRLIAKTHKYHALYKDFSNSINAINNILRKNGTTSVRSVYVNYQLLSPETEEYIDFDRFIDLSSFSLGAAIGYYSLLTGINLQNDTVFTGDIISGKIRSIKNLSNKLNTIVNTRPDISRIYYPKENDSDNDLLELINGYKDQLTFIPVELDGLESLLESLFGIKIIDAKKHIEDEFSKNKNIELLNDTELDFKDIIESHSNYFIRKNELASFQHMYAQMLMNNKSNILWIHGPSDTGKSAFCANIVRSSLLLDDCFSIPFFFDRDDHRTNKPMFINGIYYSLQKYGFTLDKDDILTWLSKYAFTRKIVFILDGLDQIHTTDLQNVIRDLLNINKNCFFICSSDSDCVWWNSELTNSPYKLRINEFNAEEIAKIFQDDIQNGMLDSLPNNQKVELLSPVFIASILQKTSGGIAEQVLRIRRRLIDYKNKFDLSNIGDLFDSYEKIFNQYVQKNDVSKYVLYCLLFSYEPLTISLLSEMMEELLDLRIDSEHVNSLSFFVTFIEGPTKSKSGYRFVSARAKRVVGEMFSNEDTFVKKHFKEKLLAWYEKGLAHKSLYMYRYMPYYLAATEQYKRLYQILIDADFKEAHFQLFNASYHRLLQQLRSGIKVAVDNKHWKEICELAIHYQHIKEDFQKDPINKLSVKDGLTASLRSIGYLESKQSQIMWNFIVSCELLKNNRSHHRIKEILKDAQNLNTSIHNEYFVDIFIIFLTHLIGKCYNIINSQYDIDELLEYFFNGLNQESQIKACSLLIKRRKLSQANEFINLLRSDVDDYAKNALWRELALAYLQVNDISIASEIVNKITDFNIQTWLRIDIAVSQYLTDKVVISTEDFHNNNSQNIDWQKIVYYLTLASIEKSNSERKNHFFMTAQRIFNELRTSHKATKETTCKIFISFSVRYLISGDEKDAYQWFMKGLEFLNGMKGNEKYKARLFAWIITQYKLYAQTQVPHNIAQELISQAKRYFTLPPEEGIRILLLQALLFFEEIDYCIEESKKEINPNSKILFLKEIVLHLSSTNLNSSYDFVSNIPLNEWEKLKVVSGYIISSYEINGYAFVREHIEKHLAMLQNYYGPERHLGSVSRILGAIALRFDSLGIKQKALYIFDVIVKSIAPNNNFWHLITLINQSGFISDEQKRTLYGSAFVLIENDSTKFESYINSIVQSHLYSKEDIESFIDNFLSANKIRPTDTSYQSDQRFKALLDLISLCISLNMNSRLFEVLNSLKIYTSMLSMKPKELIGAYSGIAYALTKGIMSNDDNLNETQESVKKSLIQEYVNLSVQIHKDNDRVYYPGEFYAAQAIKLCLDGRISKSFEIIDRIANDIMHARTIKHVCIILINKGQYQKAEELLVKLRNKHSDIVPDICTKYLEHNKLEYFMKIFPDALYDWDSTYRMIELLIRYSEIPSDSLENIYSSILKIFNNTKQTV